MRADKITQVAQSAEGKARDVHHRKRRGARFRHPRGQQDSATVRAVHYKMDHARMNKTPNRHDPPSGERMMRIFNDDIDEVFLGSMSLVRPAVWVENTHCWTALSRIASTRIRLLTLPQL